MIGLFPTHIVVDTRDGMIFNASADGRLFDRRAAIEFAKYRNKECVMGMRSYAVFRLADDDVSEVSVGYDHRPRPPVSTDVT